MKKLLILISVAIFISFLAPVHADDVFNLEDVIEPLKGFDVAGAYAKYPFVVDSVIYFIFFVGIAQLTLSKRFEGRGGKAVIIAFGVALSYSMAFWSANTGFTLARLGPLAAIILAIAFSIMIWRMFVHGEGNKSEAYWIGFIAVWIGLHMFLPAEIFTAIKENNIGAAVYGIGHILLIVAIVMTIVNFFKRSPTSDQKAGGGLADDIGGGGTTGGGGGKTKEEKAEEAEEKKEAAEEEKEEKVLLKVTREQIKKSRDLYYQVEALLNKLIGWETNNKPVGPAELNQYNADLNKILTRINALMRLDDAVKSHVEKMYKKALRKYDLSKRAASKKKWGDYMIHAKNLKDAYKTDKVFHNLLLAAHQELRKTLNLPSICHQSVYPSTPRAPDRTRDAEFNDIATGAATIKHAFNTVANIYRIEKEDIELIP